MKNRPSIRGISEAVEFTVPQIIVRSIAIEIFRTDIVVSCVVWALAKFLNCLYNTNAIGERIRNVLNENIDSKIAFFIFCPYQMHSVHRVLINFVPIL